MKKEKLKEFMGGVSRGMLFGVFVCLVILWIAGIGVQLFNGQVLHALDSLIQATLLFVVWLMGKRMERMAKIIALLSEEVQRYHDVKVLMEVMKDIAESKKNDGSEGKDTTNNGE